MNGSQIEKGKQIRNPINLNEQSNKKYIENRFQHMTRYQVYRETITKKNTNAKHEIKSACTDEAKTSIKFPQSLIKFRGRNFS